MKVQVIVKNANKGIAASDTYLNVTVTPTETLLEVQERIASLTDTIAFSEQKMIFKGEVLDGSRQLSICGIKEGDALEFHFQPSEQEFVKQLLDLLRNHPVSAEELGLLYIHRHGSNVDEVLKVLGHIDVKFCTFLADQKCFAFEGGFVKIVQANDKPQQEQPSHGPVEVKVSVQVHAFGRPSIVISDDDDEADGASLRLERSDTVAKAKQIIAAVQLVPFPDRELLLGEKKLQDDLSLCDAGVTDGSSLVLSVRASESALVSQLTVLIKEYSMLSPNELSLHYCQRHGTPVNQALRTLGLHGNFRRFLEGNPCFSVNGGCVTVVDLPRIEEEDDEHFDILDSVTDLLSKCCFLNIDFIESNLQGPDGKALVTVFVKDLHVASDSVLGSLKSALAAVLQGSLDGGSNMECASVADDVMMVHMKDQSAYLRLAVTPS
jgi:uncharacterized ubiquitin-like protein YukD